MLLDYTLRVRSQSELMHCSLQPNKQEASECLNGFGRNKDGYLIIGGLASGGVCPQHLPARLFFCCTDWTAMRAKKRQCCSAHAPSRVQS